MTIMRSYLFSAFRIALFTLCFSSINHAQNVTVNCQVTGQGTVYSDGDQRPIVRCDTNKGPKVPTGTRFQLPLPATIWGPVDADVLGTCTPAVHDRWVIRAEDGFNYRTWHPQVDPSGCVYAHEHGMDPQTQSDLWVKTNVDLRFGYAARRMPSPAEPQGHLEAHEGYKVFVANVGDVNDEGRINRTASSSVVHMGTGRAKRFSTPHHSNAIAYRYQTGSPYAATHLLLETGGANPVCDPRAQSPTKDGLILGQSCRVDSPYEIWSMQQSIVDGLGREIYRGFATPAVFDPITVFNPQQPDETVYAWDPRVSAIKNFPNDWSGHRGCDREAYAQVGYFYNQNGPTEYWTDAMGHVTLPGPLAIQQIVAAVDSVGLASTQDNLQFKRRVSMCGSIGKLGLKN